MTPDQIAAQASVFIQMEREHEALVREVLALYSASLASGDMSSPETTRWLNRAGPINDRIDRLSNARLALLEKMSDADSSAVQRLVRAEIKDFWYHIPNATPPVEHA